VSMAFFGSSRKSEHLSPWCDLVDTVVIGNNNVAVLIQCNAPEPSEPSKDPFSVSMAYLASADSVDTWPCGVILRIRYFSSSVTTTSPSSSTVIPLG